MTKDELISSSLDNGSTGLQVESHDSLFEQSGTISLFMAPLQARQDLRYRGLRG